MTYFDKLNKELKEYFMILCNNDYPEFIEKYITTEELQRLSKIGQFCGCDYTNLYNIKCWYSRLDHSVACALITWNFTKDKKQTISALVHDLGTPAFSHCIDYLLGDFANQESSERDIFSIINNSKELKNILLEDNITVEDVANMEKHTILENKKPKICADRLEGVLHSVLIWLNKWPLNEVEEVYRNIIVLKNEDDEAELGFKNKLSAEKFYEAAYEYSIALQQNEDKYTMQFISDILKATINKKILTMEVLYKLSEAEIINTIKKDNELNNKWNIFVNANELIRINNEPKDVYYVSVEAKKRYVIPLCIYKNKTLRANDCSSKINKLLQSYLNYKDTKYSYIPGIKF